jgi:hypothetical protein
MRIVSVNNTCIVSCLLRLSLRISLITELGRLHKNSMRFSVDEAEVHSFVSLILRLVLTFRRTELKRNDRQGMRYRMSWHSTAEMQFKRSKSTRNGKSRYEKS